MDLKTYSQVYATRPLPEQEQRSIKGFGAVLFGLEVVFMAWCFIVKAFGVPELVSLSVIRILTFVIAVFFIITGVLLYRAYYTFWCTPFPLGAPLWLGLIFGGLACAWTFSFVVLIFLIVLFAVIIPQQKLQREAFVKAQATKDPVAGNSEDTEQAVGAGASSRVAQTMAKSNDSAAQGAGGGYGLPVALAIISVLNIMCSGQLAAGMANSVFSSYFSAGRGLVVMFGWLFLLPGAIMGIIFFFVALARVRLMRKYGVSKGGVMTAYIVLAILAAISVLPFVIFWFLAALALGD